MDTKGLVLGDESNLWEACSRNSVVLGRDNGADLWGTYTRDTTD